MVWNEKYFSIFLSPHRATLHLDVSLKKKLNEKWEDSTDDDDKENRERISPN